MVTVDCRGQACPQPVLETKKALERPDVQEMVVLVDNIGSRENVRRFAENQGHQVTVAEEAGFFRVGIVKARGLEGTRGESRPRESAGPGSGDLVVFIDSDCLGRGPEELGRLLMRVFLQTLEQSEVKPKKILFMNSGVKLACEGSEVLEELQEFALKGVEILSCGTCLDYFGLKKKLVAGKVSNMYEIINSMAEAGKVLKI